MAARFALKCAKESAGSIPLPNICIGSWAWGDNMTWKNASEDARELLNGAWETMQKQGLNFVDTAEVYGNGESERIIRQLRDGSPEEFKQKLIIASKYLPIPLPPTKLFMPSGVVNSCRNSLERMGLESMDLYQIHGPIHFLNSIDSVAGGLAKCVELGLARAVGVSNYSKDEMIKMDEALKKRGMRLASNQVEFSLLRTLPEKSGLLEECKQRGIVMMAYSPLGMGRLTGKYTAKNPPPSGRRFGNYSMEQLSPLLDTLHKVAATHDVKPSAVALKWVVQKGAIPLGGVKNATQAEENARAASEEWLLSEQEMADLEKDSIVGTTSMMWQHG
ncbi:putative aldo/keto reductase [Seiridium cupressi]|uniref:NADP-dependent oxidoreductase domain-containing protein n=1 Tax=Seiridium unicorne TaxID=138068 RepID=A0ABR2UIX8_9PEZI